MNGSSKAAEGTAEGGAATEAGAAGEVPKGGAEGR